MSKLAEFQCLREQRHKPVGPWYLAGQRAALNPTRLVLDLPIVPTDRAASTFDNSSV